jgi:YfiH family protein
LSFHLDSAGILRLDAWGDLPWLLHGFTTRRAGDFGNGTPDAESLQRLGAEGMRLRTVRQIHSNRVLLVGAGPAGASDAQDTAQRPMADALVTDLAGDLLAVRTADCLPLLLVDRGKRAVATVHAGWRGTQQRIAARAVETMWERFGSDPAVVEAAIGPGIGGCCFEVGHEVAAQFEPRFTIPPRDAAPPEQAPAAAGRAPRPHVDLVEVNRQQLLEQGIPARHLWSSGRCTCCQEDDFFSYRRDGATARMLAFVGVRNV